jgi:hypothetical protein
MTHRAHAAGLRLLTFFGWLGLGVAAAAGIEFQRLPEGGVQPQAVTDAEHSVHLVWLGGEPKASDVFYQKFTEGRAVTTSPLRVNSQLGSAIAVGTIRGAQFALGRSGRVHVVWNGSNGARPRPADSSPLLYSRLDDSGKVFEPQRNLIAHTTDLDGGGTLAADLAGNVFVLWHAGTPGSKTTEDKRRVFLARSGDDGRTSSAETPITDATGACGCCGMRALADGEGDLFALFRSARGGVHRETTLLSSRDHGVTFDRAAVQDWETGMCPMSSAALGVTSRGMLAAWETKGKIYFRHLRTAVGEANATETVTAGPGAKHPALATNLRGETLLVWTEGTGWQRGGDFAWQVFDAAGKPTAEHGRKSGIPVWSFAAAFARPDGTFVIVY